MRWSSAAWRHSAPRSPDDTSVGFYIILTAEVLELGPNASVLEGDVVEAVRALRDGDGPPIGLGTGAELFATLSGAGLIDDYRFLVIPTAIGRAKALFASLSSPLRLRLTGTRTFASGTVLLEYVPA